MPLLCLEEKNVHNNWLILPTHKWSVMGVRRSVIGAPVNIRVGPADHVQRFVLDLVHQPRRRRRAAVRNPISIVSRFIVTRILQQGVILCGKVGCVDLWLFGVVVVVSDSLDDVRGVVCGAAHAPRWEGDAAHHRGQV